ncbi:MAG: tRNA (guanosine(37)-N1)-methyltransferase TrmD [Kiritimatiellae bacterium]|nr:tRNA (guanosine(37)-N1)-methyltransferase TrmD [Kiritimatiellia bacterium]
MRIDVITLFPGMLKGFLEESMLRRATRQEAVRFRVVDLRDFAHDARRTADDRPYGGGPGMVMKPEPLFEAVEAVRTAEARVILMTPQGRRFDQACARRLARETHLVLVCGHYEGVDERVREALATDELSIGDYVLTNGALPAAVVVDAVVRLLPGVLGGGEAATREESFTENLLEHPQYTRPPEFRGMRVPDVLLGGNHAEVAAWQRERSRQRTARRRPDLLPSDGSRAGGRTRTKRL